MRDELREIDQLTVTVWRMGVGYWYTISARDDSGDQMSLESSEVRDLPRSVVGLSPGDAARVILYACAVDQAYESPSR